MEHAGCEPLSRLNIQWVPRGVQTVAVDGHDSGSSNNVAAASGSGGDVGGDVAVAENTGVKGSPAGTAGGDDDTDSRDAGSTTEATAARITTASANAPAPAPAAQAYGMSSVRRPAQRWLYYDQPSQIDALLLYPLPPTAVCMHSFCTLLLS